jgi:hypothetical protein
MKSSLRYQEGHLYEHHGAWYVRYRRKVRHEDGSSTGNGWPGAWGARAILRTPLTSSGVGRNSCWLSIAIAQCLLKNHDRRVRRRSLSSLGQRGATRQHKPRLSSHLENLSSRSSREHWIARISNCGRQSDIGSDCAREGSLEEHTPTNQVGS